MHATTTKMYRLRERLAQEFEEILNTKTVITDDTGKPIMVDGKPLVKAHSPAMYNVIRQFLKDGGIDRDPLPGDVPEGHIVDSLPFAEPDVVSGIPQHLLTSLNESEGEDL
ncbi:MAG: hypothetical protein ACRCZI_09595 [Cetobacterium sp.]